MAYSEDLAWRIREQLAGTSGLSEKKMFGGVGFMVHGNMACGVNGDDLIVRLGAQAYDEALARPFTRPFDMTGRPMAGWVMVGPAGVASGEALAAWVQQALAFARSLPAKA